MSSEKKITVVTKNKITIYLTRKCDLTLLTANKNRYYTGNIICANNDLGDLRSFLEQIGVDYKSRSHNENHYSIEVPYNSYHYMKITKSVKMILILKIINLKLKLLVGKDATKLIMNFIMI